MYEPCHVIGCNGFRYARFMCRKHYDYSKRNPTVELVLDDKPKVTRPKRTYTKIDELTASIPLTQGYEAIVDLEHAEYLSQFNWHINRSSTNTDYVAARRTNGFHHSYMQHDLISALPGFYIDHINRNSLDNRLQNLRVVTSAENAKNTERHENRVGVYFNKTQGFWHAYLDQPGQKRVYIGRSIFKEEAEKMLKRAKVLLNEGK